MQHMINNPNRINHGDCDWLWLTNIFHIDVYQFEPIYDLWSQWKRQSARLWSKLCIPKKTMVQTRGSGILPVHITGNTDLSDNILLNCMKSCHQVISHHSFDPSQCQLCVACAHPDVWSIATKVGSSKGRKDQVQKCFPWLKFLLGYFFCLMYNVYISLILVYCCCRSRIL